MPSTMYLINSTNESNTEPIHLSFRRAHPLKDIPKLIDYSAEAIRFHVFIMATYEYAVGIIW